MVPVTKIEPLSKQEKRQKQKAGRLCYGWRDRVQMFKDWIAVRVFRKLLMIALVFTPVPPVVLARDITGLGWQYVLMVFALFVVSLVLLVFLVWCGQAWVHHRKGTTVAEGTYRYIGTGAYEEAVYWPNAVPPFGFQFGPYGPKIGYTAGGISTGEYLTEASVVKNPPAWLVQQPWEWEKID